MIEVSTSIHARIKLQGNKRKQSVSVEDVIDPTAIDQPPRQNLKKDVDFGPDFIYIEARRWDNWIARGLYKLMHILFASFLFYFVPFFSLVLSYQVPYDHAVKAATESY